jgi:hypothetical protein
MGSFKAISKRVNFVFGETRHRLVSKQNSASSFCGKVAYVTGLSASKREMSYRTMLDEVIS